MHPRARISYSVTERLREKADPTASSSCLANEFNQKTEIN